MKVLQILLIVLGAITNRVQSEEGKAIWNTTAMDVLKQDLRMTYDVKERAMSLEGKLEIDIHLRHVEVNEIRSTVTIYGRIKWNWVDDKLQWNASNYENITTASGRIDEFWYPHLDVLNSAEGSEISTDGLIVVQNNGSAEFQNNFQLTTFFGMNMHYWPFDSHKCTFEFETSLNPLMTVAMSYYGKEKFAADFVSSEWQVDGVLFGRAFWESKKNVLLLTMQITRQGYSYSVTLITSVTVIILLTLAGFWLPVQSGEKILLNGIVAVLTTILMLYFGNKLPNMGIHTPLVVQFCSFTLYMTTLSMVISIVVLGISRNQHVYSLPWSIKRVLESKPAQWLLLHNVFCSKSPNGNRQSHPNETRSVDIQIAEDEDNDYDDIEPESEGNSVAAENIAPKERNSVQEDWILLATLIDRIAFLIYSLIFIVIAIVYHV